MHRTKAPSPVASATLVYKKLAHVRRVAAIRSGLPTSPPST